MSPYIAYIDKRFSASSRSVIDRANAIIADYAAQGFDLTLRQLYYQFVARGLIPNRDTEYKRLGSIINDARLAGLIDWNAIQDRTRTLRTRQRWNSPEEIMRAVGSQYHKDLWSNQEYRPEVWIEKDALVGVIAGVREELDVPYFSARGYNSQSEQHAAGQRFLDYIDQGQEPVVFHLGDHDPSGIDMTRDNLDRLRLFTGGVEVRRLALNMDQVSQYDPPPNPAKTKDSRFAAYIALYGSESWELDALEPQVIATLIRRAVEELRDETKWQVRQDEIAEEKAMLANAAQHWADIEAYLRNGNGGKPE